MTRRLQALFHKTRQRRVAAAVGLVILVAAFGLANLNFVGARLAFSHPAQLFQEVRLTQLDEEPPRQVLVLHSYHQGYPWTDSVQQALTELLNGDRIQLHVVYMDAKRLTEADSYRLTEEMLRHWYLDTSLAFNAIVASDDPALDFLFQHRDRLFAGVPVVFLGANAFDETRLAHVTGFTGVNEEISLRETLDTALRLKPQTQKLAVISDATQTGQRNVELMRALAPEYAAKIEIIYLENLEPATLAESLRQLTPRDAVLYLSYLRTPAGHSLSVAESVGFVSQTSAAPVFGCWDFLMGHGFVGGKVVNGYAQGQVAAQMVQKILSGTKPEDIPVLMTSPNQHMFDYQQLQRFGIPLRALPEGSLVLNPPPPSWLEYWPWILASLGIILLQAAFITQLFISRNKIKQSQAALRHSEENFKAIANYTVNWESWFGLDGKYLWVNPAVERFTGYTPEEILAMPDFAQTVIAAEDRAIFNEKFAEALQGMPGKDFELRYLRKDGSTHWLSIAWQSIFDNQGRPLGVRASGQDITARKLTEDRLRLQSTVLETSANAIVITDTTGAIEWVNPAFTTLTGYQFDEAIGRNPRHLIRSGQQEQRFYQEMWDTILAGQVWRGQIINRKKDGSLYTEEQTITPLRNQQGQLTHFIAIKQDITARKALEAENKKLAEQFYQAQKMDSIGQLAGGIAHDFNNLLVPIIGYAELGQMSLEPDDPLLANFTHIKEAADRAANLTRQILAFSRQQLLEMKPVDLNEIVTDFQRILSRLLREDINLQIQLNPNLSLIRADQGQIEQVLLNLVVNARDAMPAGGSLTIETDLIILDKTFAAQHPGAEPGLFALLTVSDTGHGMDAKTQQRIFEPFFTTKDRAHGTGLGLATVFGIVKQHQGNIWIFSEPGQGTIVRVYLPATVGPIIRPPDQKNAAASQLNGSETILVVEDETGVRQLVVHILQTYGYRVLQAASPQQAQELAASYAEAIHLLLTDVVMPGQNGRQLYTNLVQQRPQLKVLFMSGHADDELAPHGTLDPEVTLLAKPFSLVRLLLKVREVLGPP